MSANAVTGPAIILSIAMLPITGAAPNNQEQKLQGCLRRLQYDEARRGQVSDFIGPRAS